MLFITCKCLLKSSNSKQLGSASQQLVMAAQRSQANPGDAQAKQALQDRAQKVKGALQELIKGVNENLGPAVMGVRELTGAQVQIIEATKQFSSPQDHGNTEATPQTIVKELRRINTLKMISTIYLMI